jgi:hypothetical protein
MEEKKDIVKEIKVWITPALLSLVSMMLYQNMEEMKSDIKILLNQTAGDHARIENLEKTVIRFENYLYKNTKPTSSNYGDHFEMYRQPVLFKEEEKEVKPTNI